MSKPLVIDLFCGLGGWSRAFLDEGWDAIGFDIERHDYGSGGYPGQLVLQDVCSLHGAQLAELKPACIVASSPCQEFSYRAMPWRRAKALPPPVLGINLFWQAFRIQQQLSEALGYWVPLVAENVRGAQPWVGRARANFGSFFFWGDIEQVGRRIVRRGPVEFGSAQLAAPARAGGKLNPDGTAHPQGFLFKIADSKNRGVKRPGMNWSDRDNPDRMFNDCRKGPGGDYYFRKKDTSSNSSARKAASAMIAMIPYPLAQHVARIYKP